MPTLNEYFLMESQGLTVDIAQALQIGQKLGDEITYIRNSMDALLTSQGITPPANWGSLEELADVLFVKLGLRNPKMGSTGKDVLEILKDDHAIIPLLSEWRQLNKLKTSFIDSLLEITHNGKVYPSFRTTGSNTGRSSGSDPNLLQIPAHGRGTVVRTLFVLPEDFHFVSIDFSGQELRIQADLSGDAKLIAVAESGDIYAEAAAAFYGGQASQYKKGMVQRDLGKKAVLAMNYGAQANKIAGIFGSSKEKGQAFITNFYSRFPMWKAWRDMMVQQAKKKGYVETKLGLRRHLDFKRPGLDKFQMFEMERQAINSPVQGTASNQTKLAYVLTARHLRRKGYKSYVLFPIHDELLFAIHKDELDGPVLDELRTIMTTCLPNCKVKFETTTTTYTNRWGEEYAPA
jgi:DNA polymerase-1